MLDVHPPEHRINGKKDFLVHMATITLGLLIALGLENGVEALHHRHQRKESESLIRQEIESNRNELMQGTPGLKTELTGMHVVLSALDKIASGQKADLEQKELQFSDGPLQDSAWRTASSTGTLSYMDYAEVEKFADAYKEQGMLETMEEKTLDDYLELEPILHIDGSTTIDAERARMAIPYARNAMGHLSGMYFIGIGTLQTYAVALK
jgi:hypothetical protein